MFSNVSLHLTVCMYCLVIKRLGAMLMLGIGKFCKVLTACPYAFLLFSITMVLHVLGSFRDN